MASENDCKAIEKCIKDLLYNKSSPSPSHLPFPSPLRLQSSVTGQLFDSGHLAPNLEEHACLTDSSFKSRIPFGDLTASQEKQIDQPCSSELIDLNVLKNFADQHLNDAHFPTSSLSLNCDKIPLPHPELDDSQVKLDNENTQDSKTDISVLLNTITKEIQNSPNFRSMPENPFSQQIRSPSKISKSNKANENTKKSSFASQEEKKEYIKQQKKLKKKLKKEQNTIKKNVVVSNVGSYLTRTAPPENTLHAEIQSLREKLQAQNAVEKPGNNSYEKADGSNQLQNSGKVIKVKKEHPSSNWREYSFIVKKSNYHFFCDVCDYNSTDEGAIIKHLRLSGHKEQKELREADIYLPYLPDPLLEQDEAVTEIILKQASQYGLSKLHLTTRINVAENLKAFIEKNIPSCTTELVGSSLSQFGHSSSEVDFILKVPSDINAADALLNTFDLLSKDTAYAKVYDFFKKKIPQIKFLDVNSGLTCTLILDNGSAFQLAKLLSTYAQLDDRVRILGTVLRNWAHVCEIDNQDSGTLPSFSYALLLIYFLQQTEPPVLPVLHEVEGYNGTTDFWDTYLLEKKWQSENTDSVGVLWMKFFHFYNYVYKSGEHVVCIRSLKKVSCKEKNWGTKFYAIEDPFVKRNIAYVIPSHQVYRYIQQCFIRTYRHFAYPRLSSGVIPIKAKDSDPLRDGSFEAATDAVLNGSFSKEDAHEDNDISDNSFSNEVADLLEDHDPDIPVEHLISTISKLILDVGKADEESAEPNDSSKFPELDSSFDAPENSKDSSPQKELRSSTNEVVESKVKNLKEFYFWDVDGKNIDKKNFQYEFRKRTFRGEKCVPLFCKSCLGKGHLKNDCPAEELPHVYPLPEMTSSFLEIIDKVCYSIMDDNMPTAQEVRCRKCDMQEIQDFIRETFPDGTLHLFGSYCNGFGFKGSDMDFCLTFESKENGKDLDCSDIIKKLADRLEHHPKLLNVVPITSAKVPIVKFSHKDSGLEGDISLYNTLGQHNTKMLEAYSKIDHRVKVLGYVLKHFAKVLRICDASRGSLSSYAYILMVIFFLQQRNPPVIPVLQELCNEQNSVFMVEGWNAWFFEDINKVKEEWADYGKNKETVGELWLGLLNFYVNEFNLKEHVVCIRQKQLLTRFRKLWISDQIAIEDPFDLNHNLGAGLSRKMNSYILRAFIRGRERFGKPLSIERMNTILGNEMAFLFECRFLSDGQDPPNDRGCRTCGKIGHIARDCPGRNEGRRDNRPGKFREMNKHSPVAPQQYGNRYVNQNRQRRVNTDRQGYRNQPVNRRVDQQPIRNNNYIPAAHAPAISPNIKIEAQQRVQHPLGIPAHRFPPPGYQANHQAPPGFPTNPPPGFSSSLPQNLPNYLPPFGNQRPMMTSPFPMNKMPDAAQNPPKQFSASPPKQLRPPAKALHDPVWGSGRPGYSQDQYNSNHGQSQGRYFQNRNSRPANQQSNHQGYDRTRTNSDSNQYNVPYSHRW